MSMLTPSGMGGKYRITGNQYPRMRRPRRRGRLVAAIVATLATIGLIGWGTLQLIDVFGGGKGGPKAQAAPGHRSGCKPDAKSSAHPSASQSAGPSAKATQPAALPKPGAIIGVNIYNSTTRAGLAKAAADELAKRGFKVGKFGNAIAPYDKNVKEPALIVAGPGGEAAAKVVGSQVAGSTVKIDPKRTDPTVDLMIGAAYTKLLAPEEAEKALTAPAKPTPTPSGGC